MTPQHRLRRAILHAAAAACVVVPLSGFLGLDSLFSPGKDLWERWRTHNAASTAVIDHAPWTAILQTYVVMGDDGVARFDYGGVSEADRMALANYTARLSRTRISSYNRGEQKAYWINFYNALTVRLILENYPVDSIREIDLSPGLTSDGPWDKKLMVVEGEEITLNDIEHRILRPIWDDPRIHYALNCASIGCPNLQPQAYTARNMDTLLNAGARAYVNHPRGVTLLPGNELLVSSIYDWFEEDFGDSEEGVIRHLAAFAEPPLRQVLETLDEIEDYTYDWSLNDTASR
jgi:hypothetical protein